MQDVFFNILQTGVTVGLAWTPGNLETWKPEDWVAKLGEFLVAPPTNKYK